MSFLLKYGESDTKIYLPRPGVPTPKDPKLIDDVMKRYYSLYPSPRPRMFLHRLLHQLGVSEQ